MSELPSVDESQLGGQTALSFAHADDGPSLAVVGKQKDACPPG
ncbi:MAG: hypothetical protein WCI11_02715 [Candidatus Methylumidiphilus sp.]